MQLELHCNDKEVPVAAIQMDIIGSVQWSIQSNWPDFNFGVICEL